MPPLAVTDTQQHAIANHIDGPQMPRVDIPQPARIGHLQGGPQMQLVGRPNDPPAFLGHQHFRNGAMFGQPHRLEKRPISRHGDAVEELNRAQHGPHRIDRELLVPQHQKLTNLRLAQLLGRTAKMLRQMSDRVQIRLNGSSLFPVQHQIFPIPLGAGAFLSIITTSSRVT